MFLKNYQQIKPLNEDKYPNVAKEQQWYIGLQLILSNDERTDLDSTSMLLLFLLREGLDGSFCLQEEAYKKV